MQLSRLAALLPLLAVVAAPARAQETPHPAVLAAAQHLSSEPASYQSELAFLHAIDSILPGVPREVRARLELARLAGISRALPWLKRSPLEDPWWIADVAEHVRYAEVQGEWMLDPDAFWALHARYVDLPYAEEIAWAAAQAPVGGECEDDLACFFGAEVDPLERYLRLYPAGAHGEEAAGRIAEAASYVDDTLAEMGACAQYGDIWMRPERLRKLDAVLARAPAPSAHEARQRIRLLLERCPGT